MSRTIRSALTFLMGAGIFVLLPLLAWDPTDIPGFLSHPARLLFLGFVCILNAIAAIRVPEIGKERARQKTVVARQHRAVVLLQVLSLSLVVAAPYCDKRGIAVMGDQDALRYIGLFLYVVGFLGMHLAEAYLGKQFNVEVSIVEGHHLVTDGPYRYVRHPRYLSMMFFAAGIALVFRSWIALALAALLTGVLLWRIRDEEGLMRKEFAADWDSYSRRTWRMIPFVY